MQMASSLSQRFYLISPLRICAIIAIRNSSSTLSRVLQHLASNQIDVIIIDNQSSDSTLSIVDDFFGYSVISILSVKHDGVYRWQKLLEVKEYIASQVEHDWIIHQDGDEILEAPSLESLREFIERCDKGGVDIIDCDEFVFLPVEAGICSLNFVECMKHYYFHSPDGRKLHRVQRRQQSKGGWAQTGGHELDSTGRTISREKIRLRHYIGTSYDDLRITYLTRVFDGEELRRGWHVRRVATDMQFIKEPLSSDLISLEIDGWVTAHPHSKHPIFNQPSPYSPPHKIHESIGPSNLVFIVTAGHLGGDEIASLFQNHERCRVHFGSSGLLDPEYIDQFVHSDNLAGYQSDDVLNIFSIQLQEKSLFSLIQRYPNARYVHVLINQSRHGLPDANLAHFSRSALPPEVWSWIWGIREIRQWAEFLNFFHEIRFEDIAHKSSKALGDLCHFLGVSAPPALPLSWSCGVSPADNRRLLTEEGWSLISPLLRDLGYDAK